MLYPLSYGRVVASTTVTEHISHRKGFYGVESAGAAPLLEFLYGRRKDEHLRVY